jgi:acetyl-CoA carboxylase biotin carboxyl carrier protein
LDGKELKELIELIAKSNFVSFELERDGFKLRLDKGASPAPVKAAPPGPAHAAAPALPPAAAEPYVPASQPAPAPAGNPAAASEAAPSGLLDMNSPIVGTFYRQPSQAAPPFVEPGSRVKKGQVLCIIEAMKLMNEIEAEIDAEVVEILVANGQPVEFGELLFRLRPMAS